MKTKNNREIKRIIILLTFIALSALMLGCGGGAANTNSAATPNVNRDTPATTAATPATPSNPTEAFAGVWETRDPRAAATSGAATTEYVRWQITPGVKNGEQYTGKITDLSNNNNDVADYVLGPGNNVTLKYSTSYISGSPSSGGGTVVSPSSTYPYEISDNGNTITLKADKPIVLKRGSSNSDLQKDAQVLSNTSTWLPTPSTKTNMSARIKYDVDYIEFQPAIVSSKGYGGKMILNTPGPNTREGTYIIAPDKKIILTIDGLESEGKYTIDGNGDLLRIKFADDTQWDFTK